MQRLSKQMKLFGALVFTLLSIGVLASVATGRVLAAAAGNTGPSPGVESYRTSNGSTANPKYVLVRSPNTGDMSEMQIPLYYDSATPPTSDFTLAVQDVLCGNQDSCGNRAPTSKDPGTNQRLEIKVGSTLLGRLQGGTVTIPSTAFSWHADTQTYRAVLTLTLRNGNNSSRPENVWRNRISFRLAVTNPTQDVYIGNAVGGTDSYVNLIAEHPNEDPARSYGYKINFATPCTVTERTRKTISLYDLDDDNADNSQMNIRVSVKTADGSAVSTSTSGQMGDRDTYKITMWFEPGEKYVLTVNGVSSINMVQYKLPFDSINTDVACTSPPSSNEPTAQCVVSDLPASVLVRRATVLRLSVQLTNYSGADPTFAARVGRASALPAFSTLAPTKTGTVPNQTYTAELSFTPRTPGDYTVQWKLTGGISATCSGVVSAGSRPYFEVYGGDTTVGTSETTEADIVAWNVDNISGDNDYSGSGSNLATIATGDIRGFVTSKGVLPPWLLSFANVPTPTGRGMYGGGFKSLPSKYSYESSAYSTAHTMSGHDFDVGGKSGSYVMNGNVTVHGTVDPGAYIRLIVESGNVYVTGVDYNYTDINTIPRFTVYATSGDVVVSSSVRSLHGNYIASGTFYSCGSGPSDGYKYADLTNNRSLISQCNSQLTIYGTVSAKRLILSRTYGSYADPVGGGAEVFKYGPEAWLSTPVDTTKFDSYISLPPVL